MQAQFAGNLRCPARDCGASGLRVEAERVETIRYRTGPVEEVRTGAMLCRACGRRYPIENYVPSFEQLFPNELQEEARYWSDWYGFFWDRGHKGFADLRITPVPFIAQGIEIPEPQAGAARSVDPPGTHRLLADHLSVRSSGHILDVGCGCGWSSLYLARRGHRVAAFDPCAGNVRRAKEYSIEQGEYIEYMVGALGFVDFEPEVFDGVSALHSLHHVPDLCVEVARLCEWLREGGVIAVDEHVQTDYILCAVRGELEEWFEREVAPAYKSLPIEELASLPKSATSRMEDAGRAQLLEALSCNFAIDLFDSRFVSLDRFSFMYYLSNDRDPATFHRASEMVEQLYEELKREHPERVEYVTLVGRKSDRPGPATGELCSLKGMLDEQSRMRDVSVDLKRGLAAGEWNKLEAGSANRELKKLWSVYEQAVHSAESIGELQAKVDDLNNTLDVKNDHIAHLERQIALLEQDASGKQAALDNQAQLLRRIESGRVMRLLNRLNKQ